MTDIENVGKISKDDFKKIKNGLFYEKLKEKGYKINPVIIFGALLIPVFIIFFLGFTEGWGEKWSVSCPSTSLVSCRNVFYECNPYQTEYFCPDPDLKSLVCSEDPGFCMLPLLPPGFRAGHTPHPLESNFMPITLSVLVLGYGLNHLVYNKKSQREVRKNAFLSSVRKEDSKKRGM